MNTPVKGETNFKGGIRRKQKKSFSLVHPLARSVRTAIVIAGSGICNDSRVVNYLKAMQGDERDDVRFVGCEAEGSTIGRDMQRSGPNNGCVWLDYEKTPSGRRYKP